MSSAWKLGLGSVNGRTVITTSLPTTGIGGLIANVLFSNVPQLILSMLYFTYNGLFTCMLSAFEWNTYSKERKGLRVSRNPQGAQRSTYFLQLPYLYSVPLLVLSMVLHWLVSQSLFFINIKMLNANGGAISQSEIEISYAEIDTLMSCGYSPVAILFTTLIGIGLVIFVLFTSRRKIIGGMPMVGGCSAAISAACHGYTDDSSRLPLQWGAISTASSATSRLGSSNYDSKGFGMTESDVGLLPMEKVGLDESKDNVGHCTFSSGYVEAPNDGMVYAGGEICR
jgi:hypothetical protein